MRASPLLKLHTKVKNCCTILCSIQKKKIVVLSHNVGIAVQGISVQIKSVNFLLVRRTTIQALAAAKTFRGKANAQNLHLKRTSTTTPRVLYIYFVRLIYQLKING